MISRGLPSTVIERPMTDAVAAEFLLPVSVGEQYGCRRSGRIVGAGEEAAERGT